MFSHNAQQDANPIFVHDVQLAHMDPALKGLLESSIAEHDCSFSAVNMRGTDVHIRSGSADRSVPVWMSKRYARILQDVGVSVQYSHFPKLDHWWYVLTVPFHAHTHTHTRAHSNTQAALRLHAPDPSAFHLSSERPTMTFMISLVPSRIWCTRASLR